MSHTGKEHLTIDIYCVFGYLVPQFSSFKLTMYRSIEVIVGKLNIEFIIQLRE